MKTLKKPDKQLSNVENLVDKLKTKYPHVLKKYGILAEDILRKSKEEKFPMGEEGSFTRLLCGTYNWPNSEYENLAKEIIILEGEEELAFNWFSRSSLAEFKKENNL